MKNVYERTKGWAAGIILMLERMRLQGIDAESSADVAYSWVFDYFAGEIFDKTPKEIQDFLLKTALLPILNVPLSEKLTGIGQAGRIFLTLNRHNYFTERLAGNRQDYQYHPLFRDFLLNRLKTTVTPSELAVLRKEAARLLERAGQIEDAAKLYCDAGEVRYLSRIVTHHAQELLGQGRNQTLKEWIAAIPEKMTADQPWLLYWTGRCLFPFDIPLARMNLEKAFDLFKTLDDPSGLYLAWASIVDTYVFEFDDWKHLDRCINIFEDLRKIYPSFPSPETDMIASSRMLMSLILRKTDQPKWVLQWFDRVTELLKETPSHDVQLDIMFFVSLYYLWKGEYHKNILLLEGAEAEILHHKFSPFTVIHIKMMKGIHQWVTAEYGPALKILSEGFHVANQSGVHVFDSLLWSFRAAAQMASGDRKAARISLHNQMLTSVKTGKTLDIFFYHVNAAWQAFLDGDISLAAENMDTIAGKVEKMGTPYYLALYYLGMAQVAFAQKRVKDAKNHVQKAYRISVKMQSQIMEWYSLLISAFLLMQENKEKEGLRALGRALVLGRKNGYVHLEFYQPAVMQFLYAKALEKGMEIDYVKNLIRKLGLAPPLPLNAPASIAFSGNWPYPISIVTLGGFEIFKNDEPFLFTGKAQKKPLDMLKVIIAEGGVNVSVDHLTEALWPDADGDLAYKSFEMTLSRLRHLLGGDHFIRFGSGLVSIDLQSCRVDGIALAYLIEIIKKDPNGDRIDLCEKAIHLYRGPFLPADTVLPWTTNRREMLKNGMIRVAMTAGRHYERAKNWERAVDCYGKGLETDDLVEEFYQRIMVCYQKLGYRASAVKTYQHCRNTLSSYLGINPSAATEAIYSAVLQP